MKQNSDRILDARGNVFLYLKQIMFEYLSHGYVHVINTGLENKEDLLKILSPLGFSKERSFNLGGRASDSVQQKWVTPGLLRRLDYYPANFYLLPNTEVQYLKVNPQDILFFVEEAPELNSGGRVFIHSVKKIEQLVNAQVGGPELLKKIKTYGLKIITGYVDETHPDRTKNYMKSWQQLSGTNNIYEALAKLKKQTTHYDEVYLKTLDDGSQVIMTSITNPGVLTYGDETYLNMPRIAKTPPSFENGFREFLLGNNEHLTERENTILYNAYIDSQQGNSTAKGDLYLFNNTTHAHSREAFSEPNRRSILVAMGGVKFSGLNQDQINQLSADKTVNPEQLQSIVKPTFAEPMGLNSGPVNYTTPSVCEQLADNFSMNVFDLQGRDLNDKELLAEINQAFKLHGCLHITGNHHYIDALPDEVIRGLNFAEEQQFKWGGKKSGRTERTAKGQGFFSVDKYPAELTLLPHQEIFYQRVLPQRMMFHYRKVSGVSNGGRTLIHSGIKFEKVLSQTALGREIIKKFSTYGQMIITGFLDENHSLKSENFVRSWQDRFGTNDIEQAMNNCKAQSTHFDDCWKVLLPDEKSDTNRYMLMTKVTMPIFKQDQNQRYMMFPRIAYNEPNIINGFREFKFGNGEAFTADEITTLLNAFWQTREGIYQSPGDILLVDNMKFGHSREPFLESNIPRDAAVMMAGEFMTDEIGEKKVV